MCFRGGFRITAGVSGTRGIGPAAATRREFVRDAAAWAFVAAAGGGLGVRRWRRSRRTGTFPERAVAMICPYAPGGGTDLLLRHVAHAAEPLLGKPVVVNNLTGGGGAVGFSAARMARPDGHTGVMLTFEVVSLPLRGLAPFDHEDFDALLQLNRDPAALAVRADHPARTAAEWVAACRAGPPPGIGNSGPGAVWHLAAALLANRAGVEVRHVPYNGSTPALTALLGGHVDAAVASPPELMTHVRAGSLRMLAVMSETRAAGFPETPTFREGGLDLLFGTWRGLALPAGVPDGARAVLLTAFERAARSETVAEFAGRTGLNLEIRPDAEFRAMMRRQTAEVGEIMRTLGMIP